MIRDSIQLAVIQATNQQKRILGVYQTASRPMVCNKLLVAVWPQRFHAWLAILRLQYSQVFLWQELLSVIMTMSTQDAGCHATTLRTQWRRQIKGHEIITICKILFLFRLHIINILRITEKTINYNNFKLFAWQEELKLVSSVFCKVSKR